MEVVEDPEQLFFRLGVPANGKLIVPEELAENLLVREVILAAKRGPIWPSRALPSAS
jgi:hypothetical protein